MKHTRAAASVTSLPPAPKAESDARTRRYLISMSIRMACFALTLFITPYGWYTWVFAAAAAVLPYIAVVGANTGSDSVVSRAESPQQLLSTGSPQTADPQPTTPQDVLTIHERREDESS